MKFITFILALIIVAASLAPCFDRNVYSIDNAPTEIVTSGAGQDHPANDMCSPFCTCSCCVSSIDVFRSVSNLNAPLTIPEDLLVFNQSPIINSGISFWQPPKFS